MFKLQLVNLAAALVLLTHTWLLKVSNADPIPHVGTMALATPGATSQMVTGNTVAPEHVETMVMKITTGVSLVINGKNVTGNQPSQLPQPKVMLVNRITNVVSMATIILGVTKPKVAGITVVLQIANNMEQIMTGVPQEIHGSTVSEIFRVIKLVLNRRRVRTTPHVGTMATTMPGAT